jgi:hypothetical protein
MKKVSQGLLLTTGMILSALASSAQEQLTVGSWKMADVAKTSSDGKKVSSKNFETRSWYNATVPGTVLTTLVNNKVYPEPLYGENNRPDKITDSLCRTSYWYRTTISIPAHYAGKNIYLNFDGINFASAIWLNGEKVGQTVGAFTRGKFDISKIVKPGQSATIAVLVSPQPHPGVPYEHTIKDGMVANGGITAIDGPTFLCSLGWDWIPGIRDRNTGIWQKVFLSTSGKLVLSSPLVTSDLQLPDLSKADVKIQTKVSNNMGSAQSGVLEATFGTKVLTQAVSLPAYSSKILTFNTLRIDHPNLWWPNGYGSPHLYPVKLRLTVAGKSSDEMRFNFGIRKITYHVEDSENLTVSVNGVRIFCKGGNWGMDEAMKRVPRARLEAQIRMHKMANYTMIRNWVGQSTSEDFYDLCDKYGIMLWDEFFQPNPSDGPNPENIPVYLANVREKILRYRNHASIAIWCARNEGYPPKIIDDSLRKMMAELEPVRLYQPSSTAGRGVNSGGPYKWRTPAEYYVFNEAFKTEIGSVSIPTLESIQGMMPKKDWETINDDWAEHDLARGAQRGNEYPEIINSRYGQVANLADFVRKAQLANFEAFRAMYEGRNAKLFKPCTGVITWMSNPAQPSFVWQLYHHDLEPNAALFAVKKACEPVHIQLNEKEGNIQIINNLGTKLDKLHAIMRLYDISGTVLDTQDLEGNALPFAATDLGKIKWPANATLTFIKLDLSDQSGKTISDNFYWHGETSTPNNLTALNQLPVVTLKASATTQNLNGKCLIKVKLINPGKQIALMSHLQLRGQRTNKRVLPVYYSDNYVSLVPGQQRGISIEASLSDLNGDQPLIVMDGWNINVATSASKGITIKLNQAAQVANWPNTGLPIIK